KKPSAGPIESFSGLSHWRGDGLGRPRGQSSTLGLPDTKLSFKNSDFIFNEGAASGWASPLCRVVWHCRRKLAVPACKAASDPRLPGTKLRGEMLKHARVFRVGRKEQPHRSGF